MGMFFIVLAFFQVCYKNRATLNSILLRNNNLQAKNTTLVCKDKKKKRKEKRNITCIFYEFKKIGFCLNILS